MRTKFFEKYVMWRGQRFGFTHDLLADDNGKPYMERWILWCYWTIRLHKFLAPDKDQALHDHPWWFVTLPLKTYIEEVQGLDKMVRIRFVDSWRLHFRPAWYIHRVAEVQAPTWTICVTGALKHDWGFWPTPYKFVPYKEWGHYAERRGS